MRNAKRNMQPYWYALYNGKTPDYDEYGNEIGWIINYGPPVKAYGNISPSGGEAVVRQFGIDDGYDRVIVTQDRDTPINEQAVLWIDVTPELDENGGLAVDDETGAVLTPWNYIVRKVARGLPVFGCTQIVVGRVDVT